MSSRSRRALAVLLTCCGLAAATHAADAPAAAPVDLDALAIEAYEFAYPLVTMEYTRQAMTNTVAAKGTRAPMGQFVRMRSYPDASFKDVTAPNADTLYTQAWIDVSKEPWIFSIPDMKGRYALFPMLDGWTDVFQVPGKRTTGTGAQKYAITGPGWKGKLPDGVTEYKSPTGIVWILGRIYCTGTPEDYDAVHALQDQVSIVPLSAWGKAWSPPPGTVDPTLDTKISVRDRVHALDGASYFKLFAELMKTNPPVADDAPMVAKLAKLGIVPGKSFDVKSVPAPVAAAIANAPKPAQQAILSQFTASIQSGDDRYQNGWLYTSNAGVYGTKYRQRAFITAIGLGANRPQDAIYPTSDGPAQGVKYSGANRYVLTFPKGQTPPVNGFWSLTMYDAGYFFVDNPLDRYTLSQRNDLKANADGSVSLLIQHDSPGKDKESNWLPAPEGNFILMMRLYWPKDTPPSIIDGSWKLPQVTQVQ